MFLSRSQMRISGLQIGTAERSDVAFPVPRITAGLVAACLVAALPVGSVANGGGHKEADPYKLARIYFETNASACDMGIQIVFDTEGIEKAVVEDPRGRVIHVIRTKRGLLGIGGQTEGFLESIEPVIVDLVQANPDCEPDPDEPTATLDEIRALFPIGVYRFRGAAPDRSQFEHEVELTYLIPDGPVLGAPDGESGIDPDVPLTIEWERVEKTIPGLLAGGAQLPVDIIGYQVLVFDANGGEGPPEFNVTVPGTETSVTVSPEFLQPDTEYNVEVLAIETSRNQTITEGGFSTGP